MRYYQMSHAASLLAHRVFRNKDEKWKLLCNDKTYTDEEFCSKYYAKLYGSQVCETCEKEIAAITEKAAEKEAEEMEDKLKIKITVDYIIALDYTSIEELENQTGRTFKGYIDKMIEQGHFERLIRDAAPKIMGLEEIEKFEGGLI